VDQSPPNTADERKTLARATAQLGADGGLIYQQPLAPTTEAMKIDLSTLGNGLYLLSGDVSGEQRFTERVAIMKE
jgi:hypothetical protein